MRTVKMMGLASVAALYAAPAMAEDVKLDYWMWDARQKPAYEMCAAEFTKIHPDITIDVSQFSWSDYWTTITTGFVSGTAPDVFIHNVLRFPEFLDNGVMVNLSELVERDNVDTSIFRSGLTDLWTAPDGNLYGMPKDWDTVALVYNTDALADSGVDVASLTDLTWNPTDGGSFQELIRKLSVDRNGNNGLSADFDKNNVERYGLVYNRHNASGQINWSNFAYMNGFKHLDAPWTGEYNYDHPALVETIDWWRQLTLDGYAIPYSELGSLGRNALFAAGKGAIVIDGSWMINFYTNEAPFDVGFAPLPIGPQETRKSALNAVADAIWSQSKRKEEAWEWIKFMGSRECQDIIGQQAVVFPSIPAATDIAVEAHAARGVDVSAFTDIATEDQTFLYPVTYNGSEVESIITATFDRIFLGTDDIAPMLEAANDRVKSLF